MFDFCVTEKFLSFIMAFIKYARKAKAFKPDDEWHPFEAKPGGTW